MTLKTEAALAQSALSSKAMGMLEGISTFNKYSPSWFMFQADYQTATEQYHRECSHIRATVSDVVDRALAYDQALERMDAAIIKAIEENFPVIDGKLSDAPEAVATVSDIAEARTKAEANKLPLEPTGEGDKGMNEDHEAVAEAVSEEIPAIAAAE